MTSPASWASYVSLLEVFLGSSRCLLLLWSVGVIILVLVFWTETWKPLPTVIITPNFVQYGGKKRQEMPWLYCLVSRFRKHSQAERFRHLTCSQELPISRSACPNCYLTIRPVARKGYGAIAHEAKHSLELKLLKRFSSNFSGGNNHRSSTITYDYSTDRRITLSYKTKETCHGGKQ